MPGLTTTPSHSAISPATGKPIGQHEAAGLKGLSKEQYPRFWEEVTYWTTDHFSSAKWQEALKRIRRVKQEHSMILLGWHPPPRPIHSIVTPGGRQLLLYSSSSLTAPTGAHPLRPAHLPRIETGSPATPRPRWDIVSAGPATPLSATSAGPVKNAFAEGGHWASLTPKTSATGTPTATTPITAVPASPWEPDTPTDPAAKAAYEEAKSDMNKMALQLCASRHALRRSFTAENDVIHPSMVRPRDTLLAAELTLSSYLSSLPGSLVNHIDALLPVKIDAFADEEAVGARQYSIPDLSQLEDIDAWLQYDEKTGELTTILEAQRDLLRMNRERRKGREISVGEGGVKLAWATKVLDDTQFSFERRREMDGEDSDDEGYDYGNFVRSLSGRGSAETVDERWSGSMLDLTLTNSSTAYSSGRESDLDIALAQRSSSSPIKPTHGYDTLPLRNRTFTLSNLLAAAASSDPHTHTHARSRSADCYKPTSSPNYASSTHSVRRSNATANPSSSIRSRRNLSINTSNHPPSINRESSLLSPQERGTRRRGPSIRDLSSWADELKRMERKRAEIRLGVGEEGSHLRDYSVPLKEEEEEEERQVVADDGPGDRPLVHAKDNGMMINGCVHPALRGGGDGDRGSIQEEEGETKGKKNRGATGSSPRSWRCSTAVRIERDDHPDEKDNTIAADDDDDDNENGDYRDNHNNDYGSSHDGYDHDDEDMTTPTPERMAQSTHPLRSSSSPTHPPIRLSSLTALRQSPPHQLPRPSPLLIPPPNPILHPPTRYNRYAATSYERQASKKRPSPLSLVPRGQGGDQLGASKAAMLEDVTRRRGSRRIHTRASSREEEEWDAELEAMESREKMRQLGLREEGDS